MKFSVSGRSAVRIRQRSWKEKRKESTRNISVESVEKPIGNITEDKHTYTFNKLAFSFKDTKYSKIICMEWERYKQFSQCENENQRIFFFPVLLHFVSFCCIFSFSAQLGDSINFILVWIYLLVLSFSLSMCIVALSWLLLLVVLLLLLSHFHTGWKCVSTFTPTSIAADD